MSPVLRLTCSEARNQAEVGLQAALRRQSELATKPEDRRDDDHDDQLERANLDVEGAEEQLRAAERREGCL